MELVSSQIELYHLPILVLNQIKQYKTMGAAESVEPKVDNNIKKKNTLTFSNMVMESLENDLLIRLK